jgi:alkylation response protein AidB-like acyl-CoA dehydrogenase
VKIIRGLEVFGDLHDHAEIIFDNVRVPASAIVLGEGKGFEIAQGRLGPGRIHHCMRTIGQMEQALAAMVFRANNRVAFGGKLATKDSVKNMIAEGRIEIEKNRQLCYLAATMADEVGFKAARKYIGMIKVSAPRAAIELIDNAIQMHGAHGVSQDSGLSSLYKSIRTLRVADGPDAVHLGTIAQMELSGEPSEMGELVSGVNKNIFKYGKYSHVQELVGEAYKVENTKGVTSSKL